jgi:hypothetical protein
MILEKKILPEIVSKHGNWAKRTKSSNHTTQNKVEGNY